MAHWHGPVLYHTTTLTNRTNEPPLFLPAAPPNHIHTHIHINRLIFWQIYAQPLYLRGEESITFFYRREGNPFSFWTGRKMTSPTLPLLAPIGRALFFFFFGISFSSKTFALLFSFHPPTPPNLCGGGGALIIKLLLLFSPHLLLDIIGVGAGEREIEVERRIMVWGGASKVEMLGDS